MNSHAHKSTPDQFALLLQGARLNHTTINPPSSEGNIDLQWAHRAQQEDRRLRALAGETVVGAKLGLTSLSKQRAMKIDRPVFGFITDAMLIKSPINNFDYNQPRIEPELIIKISRDISKTIQFEEAHDYIAEIAPGFEIIDSRYPNYEFTFGDVIADNASAAGFSIGPWNKYAGEEISDFIGYIEENGSRLAEGALNELLGHPLSTLVALSEWIFGLGETLPSGSIILAGAMTNAFPLKAGHKYRAGIDQLGYTEVDVK